MPIKIVFSTTSDPEEARSLATTLVRERLAACVNILPNVTSVYTWQGRIENAQETLMILKTQASRVDALISRLTELHSYEVPECVAVSVESGNPSYLDWVVQESGG